MRLNKIIGMMNADEDLKATLRIIKMVLFLFVYLHCFGCTWYQVIEIDQMWIPSNPDLYLDDFYHFYD